MKTNRSVGEILASLEAQAAFHRERRRLAGILKTLGRRPGHLAEAATIAGVPPIPPDMPVGTPAHPGKSPPWQSSTSTAEPFNSARLSEP